MTCRRIALLGLLVLSASAWAEPRPGLGGVSSIRIANYNAPSVLLESREQFRPILEELNQLRRKNWRRGEAALACYSTVVVMSGKKRVGEFRIRPDNVVERPVQKGQASYSLAISPADIPVLTARLAEILPAKCDVAR